MKLINYHNGVCRDATRSPRLAINIYNTHKPGGHIYVVTKPAQQRWHLYMTDNTNTLADVRLFRIHTWGLFGYDLTDSIRACVVNDLDDDGKIATEQILYY